ncbi:MAG: hypothetical protein JNK05_03440 [Myxococcales bacterium]|nr:hypothetical protein [Myxococcales bacterium]
MSRFDDVQLWRGLDAAGARQIAQFGGDDIVCAAPFDEVSVELAMLWGSRYDTP